MKTLYFSILFIITFLPFTFSQGPDRTKPPIPGKPENLHLPEVQNFTLSNGLTVYLIQKTNVPLIEIDLQVNTGSFSDPDGKEGLASFSMDMLDEGAGQLSSLQLSDEIEYLGANISSRSYSQYSVIQCNVPVKQLEDALKLMGKIVFEPTFPQKEVERLKQLRLSGLLAAYDDPGIIASRAFGTNLFDKSLPYGRTLTESSLKSISAEDMRRFHKTNFVTGNAFMLAVGDISKAELLPLLEKYFSKMPAGNVANVALPLPKQVKGRTIVLVDKPGSTQSVISIGRIGATRTDKDYNALMIMNTILGGSFTSRLNHNLRETHGYTYGAGSFFNLLKVPGYFIANSSVQTEVTAAALSEFFKEFNNILKPVPQDEFIRGQNYHALGYATNFETNNGIANELRDMVFYGLPANYFNTYIDHSLSVKKEDMERVAKRFIDPKNMLIIIVGDASKVKADVEKLKLGKVTVVSVEDVLGKKPEI